MRLIEMAVTASHAPGIFAHASRRVGWYETRVAQRPLGARGAQQSSSLSSFLN